MLRCETIGISGSVPGLTSHFDRCLDDADEMGVCADRVGDWNDGDIGRCCRPARLCRPWPASRYRCTQGRRWHEPPSGPVPSSRDCTRAAAYSDCEGKEAHQKQRQQPVDHSRARYTWLTASIIRLRSVRRPGSVNHFRQYCIAFERAAEWRRHGWHNLHIDMSKSISLMRDSVARKILPSGVYVLSGI